MHQKSVRIYCTTGRFVPSILQCDAPYTSGAVICTFWGFFWLNFLVVVESLSRSTNYTVRFVDSITRFVLIRVSRSDYSKIRSTLTLMNTLHGRRVVVSVLSVNGNVRTAKRSAIDQVRRIYRQRLLPSFRDQEVVHSNFKDTSVSLECATFENTLVSLHAIEF